VEGKDSEWHVWIFMLDVFYFTSFKSVLFAAFNSTRWILSTDNQGLIMHTIPRYSTYSVLFHLRILQPRSSHAALCPLKSTRLHPSGTSIGKSGKFISLVRSQSPPTCLECWISVARVHLGSEVLAVHPKGDGAKKHRSCAMTPNLLDPDHSVY